MRLIATEWRGSEVRWTVESSGWSEDSGALIVQKLGHTTDSVHKAVGHSASIRGTTVFPSMQGHHFPALTETVADWNLFSKQLANCHDRHTVCKDSRTTNLPTNFRLIEVANNKVVAARPDLPYRYVALSYVWGSQSNARFLRATEANIDELSKRLPVDDLPATIRDALFVCERLGEKYLWVDCLCIKQDNAEDKAAQIKSMSAIYSAASLVIVAAHGDNMNAGLMGVSRLRQPQAHRRFSGIHVNVELPPLWDVVGKSTWDTRGWTYQEIMLSRRKLFFTERQVYLECGLQISHEESLKYPSFNPSRHEKSRYPTPTSSLYYTYNYVFSNSEKPELVQQAEWRGKAWQRHVARYSKRNLGTHSDKLNAFTGILYALYSEHEVFWGLPLPHLDIALLWNQESRYDDNIGRSDLFPSWSWASCSVELSNQQDLFRDFIGSLVLWHKPIKHDARSWRLTPIIATEGPTSWLSGLGSKIHTAVQLRVTGEEDFVRVKRDPRTSMVQALRSGLIEHSRVELPSLSDDLAFRWPDYVDFWKEVAGTEEQLHTDATILTEECAGTVNSRVIVGRAQKACLQIRVEKGRRLVDSLLFSITNKDGKQIGIIRKHEMAELMPMITTGRDTFDFIALSVCRTHEQPSNYNTFKDMEGALLEPAGVKILVVQQKGLYYYRKALATVNMKAWVDLNASFETIILA